MYIAHLYCKLGLSGLILCTKDQFVSVCLLTELCTVGDQEVIQIIYYIFVCADTPDKNSSRVMRTSFRQNESRRNETNSNKASFHMQEQLDQ